MFYEAKNSLVFKKGNETLMIEPWGKDSFRVRSTLESAFIDRDVALTEKINHGTAKINLTENGSCLCPTTPIGRGIRLKPGSVSVRIRGRVPR